ncbi:SDR family oxidoreductase [Mycobacterium sp. CBMA271]|uniref:SDR family NAD(P)-dependent oxidoreductase n=1 Tax=unclassified Mycobacteroides TaxID=2618759 RepID=UPI0012DC3E48|nr:MULTISPECIES: SDR family oxidoreductase [unclassified Mycobacteroides]MUM17891.1 oxidoreductase [Mycobacteroides sp. CBMA 326]MUM20461.1 SDR family oxidoreductase [Mycobacteroides sp. CBMA 271]
MQLAGKKALVTGGGRGMGAATAVRLAREGADVAITYASNAARAEAVVDQITGLGRTAVAINADSADAAALAAAVDEAAQLLGGLDILVSNAGRYPGGRIEDFEVAEIDSIFALHVRAVFVAVQAALNYMGSGGRIITIGSVSAERASYPGQTLYASSKAALLGLNRALARELGPRGITSVVVQPGPTDTELNPGDSPWADDVRALTAIGKFADPDHIADVVAFLAGPSGEFITGSAVTVDGGVNA